MLEKGQLHLALLQADLAWENPVLNRKLLTQTINNLPKTIDLIVLPEMFTTGFTMNTIPFAESMKGTTLHWMKTLANKTQSAITGSIIITENGQYYNRLLFVIPDGEVYYYDKKHLFALAQEHKYFTPGTKKIIVNYKGWKICPLICYDLRFPVWSRNVEEYDLLIYVANWPKQRIFAWDTLLKARAIENMSYSVGLNRIGQDIHGKTYTGHSAVYSPLGKKVKVIKNSNEHVLCFHIHKRDLIKLRKKYPFLEDKEDFIVKNKF